MVCHFLIIPPCYRSYGQCNRSDDCVSHAIKTGHIAGDLFPKPSMSSMNTEGLPSAFHEVCVGPEAVIARDGRSSWPSAKLALIFRLLSWSIVLKKIRCMIMNCLNRNGIQKDRSTDSAASSVRYYGVSGALADSNFQEITPVFLEKLFPDGAIIGDVKQATKSTL